MWQTINSMEIMMEKARGKKCTRCKNIKNISDFYKNKHNKDGFEYYCKSCRKEYYKNNSYFEKYREKNREKLLEDKKKHYRDNKEYYAEKSREYVKKNRKKISEYWKAKRHSDVNFKIAHSLRSRLSRIVNKNPKASAIKFLGCSVEYFRLYIENLFDDRMNWENHGEWHFDHIVPLSSFDLTDIEEFKKACHYSNIQPLWAKDNLCKGSKITNVPLEPLSD